MDADQIDEATVLALSHAAAIDVLADDLDLLTRAMRRLADVCAPLALADLEGAEWSVRHDPRVGW